ncbi:recombinase RecT [Rhodococcus qingshengii]|uniref:recombinase RecT n=1 Tax=Rhodococcus qingshengii TaxID=334542 RepID=UPI001C234059|nr:recombinase RecT [Rhodococcus qingshengii]QXC40904.1 recombinase RecT [Rhodococcus qingshengii]
MTNQIAVRGNTTDLVIDPTQSTFTDVQVAALRQLGVEDAPKGDLDLFFHQAKRTGLDPFAKQIYMLGRRTKIKVWNERAKRQDEEWVMKYTIQTGIDGYRVTGHRLARLAGDDIAVEGPFWRGADGGWDDVWLDPNRPPLAAKYIVVKNGVKYSSVAMYGEYVQTYSKDGQQVPNSMWAKMPANQLAKCAEAAAWKKAYPNDFSGMVLEDAVQVIEAESTSVTSERVPAPKGGTAGLAAALGVTAEPEQPAIEARATPDELQELLAALDKHGIEVSERAAFFAGRLARPKGQELSGLEDLTSVEVATTIQFLETGEEPAE